jgi:hypothetical protein
MQARTSPPATVTGTSSRKWHDTATAVKRRWHAKPLVWRRRLPRGNGRDRNAHVGYYLIDRGRQDLEHAVGCRPSWRSRIRRVAREQSLPLYLGPILLLTLLVAAVVVSLGGSGPGDGRTWILALPLFIAASALAISLVNLLVTRVLSPRALPRMDFSRGIPDHHRTMVIVPTLLAHPQDVDDLLEAMEIRYLGNRDPNLFFALLTDFRDAPKRRMPGDAALIAHARSAVEALNESYRLLPVPPAAGLESARAAVDGHTSASAASWSSSTPAAGRAA